MFLYKSLVKVVTASAIHSNIVSCADNEIEEGKTQHVEPWSSIINVCGVLPKLVIEQIRSHTHG